MPKYTFWRNAIVAETYIIEAKDEEAARQQLWDGEVEVFSEEFIDWATSDFQLEDVEDELVTFLQSKELT
jgi:hypothetical protein